MVMSTNAQPTNAPLGQDGEKLLKEAIDHFEVQLTELKKPHNRATCNRPTYLKYLIGERLLEVLSKIWEALIAVPKPSWLLLLLLICKFLSMFWKVLINPSILIPLMLLLSLGLMFRWGVLLIRKQAVRSRRAIEKFKEDQKREQSEWQNRVKEVLAARDNIKIIIEGEASTIRDHTKSDYINDLIILDDRLKSQSGKIFRTKNLEELRAIYKPETEDWWWHPTPPQDYLDLLWKLPVFISILWSIYLGLDLASRFWAGGFFGEGSSVLPSVFGGLLAIIPTLIGILLGSETSQLSSSLGNKLRNLGIPRRYWREVIIILSGLLFIGAIIVHHMIPNYANYYYNEGASLVFIDEERKILDPDFKPLQGEADGGAYAKGDLKKNIEGESLLKVARALEPDSSKASAALGFFYELQQDIDNAKKEYRVAMRNGSQFGRIRLAKIYLRDHKEESLAVAANILLQQPLKAATDVETTIAWKTVLASVRLHQKRYYETKKLIESIFEDIKTSISTHIQSNDVKDKIQSIEPADDVDTAIFLKKILDSSKELKLDMRDPNKKLGIVDCIRIEVFKYESKILKEDFQISESKLRDIRMSKDLPKAEADLLKAQADRLKAEVNVKMKNIESLRENCADSANPKDIFQDSLRINSEKILNSETIINNKDNP
jgi:hypothetical protein